MKNDQSVTHISIMALRKWIIRIPLLLVLVSAIAIAAGEADE